MLARNIDGQKPGAKASEVDQVTQWADFMKTIENADIQPQFGNKTELNLAQFFRNGIVDYGPGHSGVWGTLSRLINQVRMSPKRPPSQKCLQP